MLSKNLASFAVKMGFSDSPLYLDNVCVGSRHGVTLHHVIPGQVNNEKTLSGILIKRNMMNIRKLSPSTLGE
jgi:hypothetical protein